MIDYALFDLKRLLDCMLDDSHGNRDMWRGEAEIVVDYMPPFPGPEMKPTVVVRWRSSFLRFSAGPRQGFLWDIYGDDFLSAELALLALIQAPVPPPALRADCWTKRGELARCDRTCSKRVCLKRCAAVANEAHRSKHCRCSDHAAVAPGPGEGSLADLLRRAIKYAREDRMVTPRATRLQRVLDEAEKLLAAAPPVAPAPPVCPKCKGRGWFGADGAAMPCDGLVHVAPAETPQPRGESSVFCNRPFDVDDDLVTLLCVKKRGHGGSCRRERFEPGHPRWRAPATPPVAPMPDDGPMEPCKCGRARERHQGDGPIWSNPGLLYCPGWRSPDVGTEGT